MVCAFELCFEVSWVRAQQVLDFRYRSKFLGSLFASKIVTNQSLASLSSNCDVSADLCVVMDDVQPAPQRMLLSKFYSLFIMRCMPSGLSLLSCTFF